MSIQRCVNANMLKSLFCNSRKKFVQCFSTSTSAYGKKLSGKVAVVTASSQGIGYSIAKRLGEDGAHVVVSSRKADKVNKAVDSLKVEGISVTGMTCHTGVESDRKALLDKVNAEHGRLDILVCNTGTNPYYGNTLDIPEAAFDKIFDVNVKATFMLIKEAVPLLKVSKNGSIVVVSSIAGYESIDKLGIYSVSKTTLLGLTKVLAPELADMSIRINCLAPGIVKTSFSKALWENPDASKLLLNAIPLKRVAHPDECAGAVSFLASDDASYVTGETVVVAGGLKSRL